MSDSLGGGGEAGPQGGEAPAPAPTATPHQQVQAQYAATSKAIGRMDKVRTSLTGLTKLGSTVQPEDVIEAAGKLVAGGESPMELAALMADMPQGGGDALAGWVAQHAATTAAKEAQLKQVHEQARHALGVSALHELVKAHMNPAGQGPALAPSGQSNALSPQSQSPAMSPQGPGAAGLGG